MIVNSQFSFWVIIPVVAFLTIFLVWQEARKLYRFRTLRVIATILMMIAVLGVFMKPSHLTTRSSKIILLTPHYSRAKIDSILSVHPDLTPMHVDQTVPYRNSKKLSNEELAKRANEIKVVIGQGLRRHQLDNMKKKTFEFIPAPRPEGISSLFISEHNFLNRKNFIKGTVNSKVGKGWVALSSPGGKEDSVAIKASGETNFALGFIPKHSGQLLYTLAIHDGNTHVREIIPIEVEDQRPLQILFLLSYPTFEMQTLKTFLARKGLSIVVRYQLSKNKFRYEYVNHDKARIDRITSSLLNDVDLVIIDSGTMSTFSSAEKTALDKSVFAGLGLLYLPPIMMKSLTTFFPFQTTSVKSDTAVIKIASRTLGFPAPALRITPNASTVPVQKNHSGILSGYTFRGAGKIGFQLLQETYRLALTGDSVSYSELWSPLVEQISRTSQDRTKIKIVTPFPWYENEPVDIELISASENISLLADSITIPLKEDVSFDNIWHARTWAGGPGWHLLEADGTSLHYYVSAPAEWATLSVVNQQNENKIHDKEFDGPAERISVWKEIPPLIFYIIFLLATGFIWLAPKL